MGVFNFYNVRKPRQYNHSPIYYDPRKEALEKRIHKVKAEMGVEETDYEQYKEAIRGSFIEGTTHLKKSRNKGDDIRNRVYKNMRLILVLAILAAVFWYLFWK
ncbi:MAG: hypothetical protein LBT35_02875 [Tannerella sp.]|jgi:3-phenylpropionate/cinnamic acid dioxygenase small subunit|nr:hypothetical protein [Tannerella sp.]